MYAGRLYRGLSLCTPDVYIEVCLCVRRTSSVLSVYAGCLLSSVVDGGVVGGARSGPRRHDSHRRNSARSVILQPPARCVVSSSIRRLGSR